MKKIILALLSASYAVGMATQVLGHGDAPHPSSAALVSGWTAGGFPRPDPPGFLPPPSSLLTVARRGAPLPSYPRRAFRNLRRYGRLCVPACRCIWTLRRAASRPFYYLPNRLAHSRFRCLATWPRGYLDAATDRAYELFQTWLSGKEIPDPEPLIRQAVTLAATN